MQKQQPPKSTWRRINFSSKIVFANNTLFWILSKRKTKQNHHMSEFTQSQVFAPYYNIKLKVSNNHNKNVPNSIVLEEYLILSYFYLSFELFHFPVKGNSRERAVNCSTMECKWIRTRCTCRTVGQLDWVFGNGIKSRFYSKFNCAFVIIYLHVILHWQYVINYQLIAKEKRFLMF